MAGNEFGSDEVLLYNVDPWNKLGFGVPNFGDKAKTANQSVWSLTDELGKLQLDLMLHIDAARTAPPSRNTIERLCKALNRMVAVLQGRMKDYPERRTEGLHATPVWRPWNIHPVPYFPGPIVVNYWMSQYNMLVCFALTNLYQHSDNDLALTITKEMAGDVAQYFRDMKLLVGRELLQINSADLAEDDFRFTEAHYDNYHPDQVTIRTEATAEPAEQAAQMTEADVRPLKRGIPATLIIPNLARYPVGPHPAPQAPNEPLPPGQQTPGVGSLDQVI